MDTKFKIHPEDIEIQIPTEIDFMYNEILTFKKEGVGATSTTLKNGKAFKEFHLISTILNIFNHSINVIDYPDGSIFNPIEMPTREASRYASPAVLKNNEFININIFETKQKSEASYRDSLKENDWTYNSLLSTLFSKNTWTSGKVFYKTEEYKGKTVKHLGILTSSYNASTLLKALSLIPVVFELKNILDEPDLKEMFIQLGAMNYDNTMRIVFDRIEKYYNAIEPEFAQLRIKEYAKQLNRNIKQPWLDKLDKQKEDYKTASDNLDYAVNQIKQIQEKLFCMDSGENPYEDLLMKLYSNRYVTNFEINEEEIIATVEAPLRYYEEHILEKINKNPDRYEYMTSKERKVLMKKYFESDDYDFMLGARFKINLNKPNLSTIKNQQYNHALPNPHLNYFSCFEQAKHIMYEQLNDHDFDLFINQMILVTSNLNLTESHSVGYLLNWFNDYKQGTPFLYDIENEEYKLWEELYETD